MDPYEIAQMIALAEYQARIVRFIELAYEQQSYRHGNAGTRPWRRQREHQSIVKLG